MRAVTIDSDLATLFTFTPHPSLNAHDRGGFTAAPVHSARGHRSRRVPRRLSREARPRGERMLARVSDAPAALSGDAHRHFRIRPEARQVRLNPCIQ